MRGGPNQDRAVVMFNAPHGAESVVLRDGDVTAFGRDASCAVRFAYAPTADHAVPRVAGRFIVAAGRVLVECGDGRGRRSMEVGVEGMPPVLLGMGEAYSPAAAEFRVAVHGDMTAWQLQVHVRPTGTESPKPLDEMPTCRFELALTDRQYEVLATYAESLALGRVEPATHREVALALGCHPNSARATLYEVWARMFAAGVPMPDMTDKRIAVTEAARLHRLLGAEPFGD